MSNDPVILQYELEAKRMANMLMSPDGEILMAHLSETFEQRSSIVPGDPYATHAREGAREVVLYLRGLIEEYQNG